MRVVRSDEESAVISPLIRCISALKVDAFRRKITNVLVSTLHMLVACQSAFIGCACGFGRLRPICLFNVAFFAHFLLIVSNFLQLRPPAALTLSQPVARNWVHSSRPD